MGKFGVKERNLEGQMVVDFAKRMDMAVVNTYFQKREGHRVTYKSGGRSTQVDYILCRRGNLKEISDCKVVVGESVARQHRMVVCRMTLMVCKKKRSKIEIEKKTKWWKLKKEECCEDFRQKLRQALGGQVVLPDDWETTAEVIRVTGRKVLGVSSGRRKEGKETWWWNEEVQDSIQRKRLAKKKWDMDRTEENRQEYKELQRRVKREVSKAKQEAYDELYTRVVIGADFNGHVGEGNTGDEEVMGKFGVKERNLEGQMVVDFAKRMDMAVVNTYFQKREGHRVTYKSGGRSTQVDYILWRRGNLKEISDCKVVVGESVARQHRMVVCRMTLMVCKKKGSKIEIEKKTKWWKLKKEECCEDFRQKLRQALGGQVVLPDDWETTAEVIRVTGRKREKRKGKSVGLRIGTLNVGTMTGKGRELADMMERRKVDILCVQETRWKGSKARSIGAGFKLFYYGVDSKRNGVGVVLKGEFGRNVLEVKRVSDRVMSLKLEIEGVMLNVVSGYAPQVGCELEEKERFWSELDEGIESIPTGERVVIGADFNGHVGEGNTGDEEVMGKFGVKERNLEGQMIVDFGLGCG
ncbi:hypothetical protein PGIGA_G00178440 [Pangasianodon gigas]|uniref:Uncharacterized protein n=1 Tax=Pangasianodon gigas TaxID=30993 RepID=A0ACC5XV50_PANGG|nr:hypothetical protein [Pangasianodon gigas]